ncbi:MAG: flagellar hook assembly protein FlgD [Spirochaetia bacterium]
MDLGNLMAPQPLRMSEDELAKTKQYVESYNTALRAERKGGQQELGKEDFLKLLITQLRYQDPLKPMEDKEFIAQMAQFSSLEQTKNMADGLEKLNTTLVAAQERSNALSFLGRHVEVMGDDGKMRSGNVDSVNPRDGLIKVNGEYFGVDQMVSVSDRAHAPVVRTASPVVSQNVENVIEGENSL